MIIIRINITMLTYAYISVILSSYNYNYNTCTTLVVCRPMLLPCQQTPNTLVTSMYHHQTYTCIATYILMIYSLLK